MLTNTQATRIPGLQILAWTLLLIISGLCHAADSIIIRDLRIKEAPPGATVTAGYFEVDNLSGAPLELIEVSSEDFGSIEIHRTVLRDGIARMIRQESVTVPAASTVSFMPGDYHLMLFRSRKQFHAGDSVLLDFVFSDQTIISTVARVEGIQARQNP
jgi:hypothetical protein